MIYMDGQVTIFEVLKALEPPKKFERILSVGDTIGRVVLGELQTAIITKVDGLPDYPFYRTTRCCYSVEEGYKDISELEQIAEENRKKYRTIIPMNLADRITVEYEPRECDGVVLWAQIGIMDNMLFWKKRWTYQFLEPYDSDKKLRRAYNKAKKEILEDPYNKYRIVEDEHPMRRLYWSSHGFFADAEYVLWNH